MASRCRKYFVWFYYSELCSRKKVDIKKTLKDRTEKSCNKYSSRGIFFPYFNTKLNEEKFAYFLNVSNNRFDNIKNASLLH